MKGEAKREESLTKTRRRRNFRGKGGVEKFAPRKLLGRRLKVDLAVKLVLHVLALLLPKLKSDLMSKIVRGKLKGFA